MAWRKGVIGEALVALTLQELSDNFVVVNDVSKRFANIDHVVIGPPAFTWWTQRIGEEQLRLTDRGTLCSTGRLYKPAVKSLLGSVMDFQSKLKALTDTDHFVRGLMVFPNAYMEANLAPPEKSIVFA